MDFDWMHNYDAIAVLLPQIYVTNLELGSTYKKLKQSFVVGIDEIVCILLLDFLQRLLE